MLAVAPTLPTDAFLTINEEQEELFGQYIAELALKNHLKLDDYDIMRASEPLNECRYRLQSGSNTSIQSMAKDLDFDEMDEDIVEMVSVVWKKI